MTRRQLAADGPFTLLRRHSQNTNVKLRTIAQTVIQTGDLPAGAEREARWHCANSQPARRRPRQPSSDCATRTRLGTCVKRGSPAAPDTAPAFGAGDGCG